MLLFCSSEQITEAAFLVEQHKVTHRTAANQVLGQGN